MATDQSDYSMRVRREETQIQSYMTKYYIHHDKLTSCWIWRAVSLSFSTIPEYVQMYTTMYNAQQYRGGNQQDLLVTNSVQRIGLRTTD